MVNLIMIGNQYNVQIKKFEIDSADEVNELPKNCEVGSEAIDLETGNKYKFRSTGQWKLMPATPVNIDIPNAENTGF